MTKQEEAIVEINLNIAGLTADIRELTRLRQQVDDQQRRITSLERDLDVARAKVGAWEKAVEQNRITTPIMVGWALTLVGMVVTVVLGVVNAVRK